MENIISILAGFVGLGLLMYLSYRVGISNGKNDMWETLFREGRVSNFIKPKSTPPMPTCMPVKQSQTIEMPDTPLIPGLPELTIDIPMPEMKPPKLGGVECQVCKKVSERGEVVAICRSCILDKGIFLKETFKAFHPIDWETHAEFLYQTLDDIDTTGDIAKGDNESYRKAVERIIQRRDICIEGETKEADSKLIWKESVKVEDLYNEYSTTESLILNCLGKKENLTLPETNEVKVECKLCGEIKKSAPICESCLFSRGIQGSC